MMIIYFKTNLIDTFVSFKKCEKRPVRGISKQLFIENDIQKTDDNDWDIYIPCGYNNVENELSNLTVFNEKQKIYGIPGCDKIVSKNNLWSIIESEYGRDEASTIMPETFVYSKTEDMDRFKNKYSKNNIYLLKRNVQRKKGIQISNDYTTLVNGYLNNFKLIQEFKQSYLINNRKFNLRYYMLIIGQNDNINVFIHNYNKILYASKLVSDDKMDFESNITNSYNLEQDIYNSHPFNLKELCNLVPDLIGIEKEINSVLLKLCRAIVLPLNKVITIKNNQKFQLFGIDVIIDKNKKPYVLEINKGPDMKAKDDRDKLMKTKILNDVFSKIEVINNDSFNLFDKIYSV